MHRSPNNLLNYRQPPSNVDNYKALGNLITKPTSERTPRQSITTQNDERNDNYNRNRTLGELVMKPSSGRTSRQSTMTQDDDHDDDHDNRTLRKLMMNQPLNPSRSRSPSTISLKSMLIEGQWKYRGHDEDKLRFKSIGIENLVSICHDIMSQTYESINRKHERRKKSPLPSESSAFPIVKLDAYRKITSTERSILQRAHVFNLMTIVYEATVTNASISQLVRIWREASEHVSKPKRLKQPDSQPLISYEQAFKHLIRTPNDQLLQIALHAPLINKKNRINLPRLGEKLGVNRDEFDMNSIRDSTKAFQYLIKYLREHKLEQIQQEKHINKKQLPCKPKKKQGLYANISGTRFHLISQAVDVSGFYISPDPDFTSNLLWTDTLISMDIVSALKPYQKVNHFPTMNEISRKDLLAKNYDRLSNSLPKEYNFAPKTWILPNEYNLWYSYAANKPKKDQSIYILKPTNSAMGEGIAIHYDYKHIQPMNNYIVQEYIREPYLIDGFKFDLRIYALITSCDPLRVFIYNNGLVRMCTKKYAKPDSTNIFDLSMHLTNFSVENEINFDLDNGKQHSFKSLIKYLKVEKQNEIKLWKEIENVVLKTIFLAAPHLLTSYRKCRPGTLSTSESVCFEILGFDILIDKNFKPWIIEVNRCPSFDVKNQLEFDLKMKLLFDTLDLLRFRPSDRKKSMEIEKIEAQQRLYANLGRHPNKKTHELDDLKENLYRFRREKTRDVFEKHHSGDYIRLFPINDEKQMNDLMILLTKSFEILSTKKNDTAWNMKYFYQFNENDLLDQIARLEDNQQEHSKLTHRSNSPFDSGRASSSNSFTFESDDEIDRSRSSSRSSQSSHSDKTKKSPSKPTDPLHKRVSTQTPRDIVRSTSLKTPKKPTNALISTGDINKPEKAPPGVSATRITEKPAVYTQSSSSSSPSENLPQQQRSHSSKPRKSNDKSQMVSYASILQANRQQQQSSTINLKQEFQLTDKELNRLNHLIFEQMNKLCIHYPNKSDKETYQICTEIIENWTRYKSILGRFWLAELDTDKRESVIEIVWNNIQQIMKKICLMDELIQQLPLHRHLIKLKRRLLANHGQPFWDTCQDKHNSWESLFIKSTNTLSNIELDCCYRFVELCQESLFVIYQYSIDEKFHKQKLINQQLRLTVKS